MAAGAATESDFTSADEKTNLQSSGKEGGPSLNSLALIRKATTPSYISSNDWSLAVYGGVLLEKDTQKFWVDEKLHKNCFLVLPKGCDIAGADEESWWSWITNEEKWFSFRSIVEIPVPKLKEFSWLLIQGRFETGVLSPNTTYEVAFVVQLAKTDSTWYTPMKLELDLPDGTKHTRIENLQSMSFYKWGELRAGEFMMRPETVGTIFFVLQGTLATAKSGLILKGVRIHPKD